MSDNTKKVPRGYYISFFRNVAKDISKRFGLLFMGNAKYDRKRNVYYEKSSYKGSSISFCIPNRINIKFFQDVTKYREKMLREIIFEVVTEINSDGEFVSKLVKTGDFLDGVSKDEMYL